MTITGDGAGGPNHEYMLALMMACGGDPTLSAMACDTDGIDGATDAAGAWFDAATADWGTDFIYSVDEGKTLTVQAVDAVMALAGRGGDSDRNQV